MCDISPSYEVTVSKPSWERDVNRRNSKVDCKGTGHNGLARIKLARGIGSNDSCLSFSNGQSASVKAGKS
jgi:hypothetical protein